MKDNLSEKSKKAAYRTGTNDAGQGGKERKERTKRVKQKDFPWKIQFSETKSMEVDRSCAATVLFNSKPTDLNHLLLFAVTKSLPFPVLL